MRYFTGFLLLSSLHLIAQDADKKPFQVLVAKDAYIYGRAVEPLQFIDDVSSIEVNEGGFLSLVHEGGTTYEHTEKIFTFYLKPQKFKNRNERPNLALLYEDSAIVASSKTIVVLSPPFDRSGYLEWNKNNPFEIFWDLGDKPFVNYVIAVSDGSGKKIQDFPTKQHSYILKPSTYGLSDGVFSFVISSSLGGETTKSKNHTVKLVSGPVYNTKATDRVLQALDMEPSPTLALEVWKKALKLPNGSFYKNLFAKFLTRNEEELTKKGVDVKQLLLQEK